MTTSVPGTRELAISSGWEYGGESCDAVTLALDEWLSTDREQRSYLHITMLWMTERYDQIWREVKAAPAVGDGPETVDRLYDRAHGVMPPEHEWLTLAATLKDAVSAHEVYLTKVLDEVLRGHGYLRRRRDNPHLEKMKLFFQLFGLHPRPPDVATVYSLRNLLTRQRGELRTERDRQEFAKHDSTGSLLVGLTEQQILGHLEVLGNHVRQVDPLLWLYAWKRRGSIPDAILRPVAGALNCDRVPPSGFLPAS